MAKAILKPTTNDFLPTIGLGTFQPSPKAKEYVNDVLSSGRLTYGPYSQKLERIFAKAHDCKFGILTNSGTSSLMIALCALKEKYHWKDGDEVLVPALTFVATANVVIQLNLKPVFVDVDPVFYEMDCSQVEKRITPRTRAIMPVHLFGLPCEMNRLKDIAQRHNLQIIEDSCESMFTRYQDQSVGSFGDIGCFSTYLAHILCTGVGGICTTNDPELAVLLRSLANHGRDAIYLNIDDDNGRTAEELRMVIARRFSFVRLGYSFRITEMEAAVGLAEFERHDWIMERRSQFAKKIILDLKGLEKHIQLPTLRPNAGHAFMMIPIVLRNESKTEFVNYLELNGIETRDMMPMTNQPVYKNLLNLRVEDFPIAQWINQNGFYFPCHQDLTDQDRSRIVETFYSYPGFKS